MAAARDLTEPVTWSDRGSGIIHFRLNERCPTRRGCGHFPVSEVRVNAQHVDLLADLRDRLVAIVSWAANALTALRRCPAGLEAGLNAASDWFLTRGSRVAEGCRVAAALSRFESAHAYRGFVLRRAGFGRIGSPILGAPRRVPSEMLQFAVANKAQLYTAILRGFGRSDFPRT